MIEKIDSSRPRVRNFGILFGSICLGVAALMIYKQSSAWYWPVAGAAFFFVTCILGFPVLRPVYIGWMRFAFVLGWINTRILLGAFFYIIITPIGFIVRLGGKDLLDQRIEKSAKTYWLKREQGSFDANRMEKMF